MYLACFTNRNARPPPKGIIETTLPSPLPDSFFFQPVIISVDEEGMTLRNALEQEMMVRYVNKNPGFSYLTHEQQVVQIAMAKDIFYVLGLAIVDTAVAEGCTLKIGEVDDGIFSLIRDATHLTHFVDNTFPNDVIFRQKITGALSGTIAKALEPYREDENTEEIKK